MALVTQAAATAIIEKLVDTVLDNAIFSWWPNSRSVQAEAEKLKAALPKIRAVLNVIEGDRISRRNRDFDAQLWQFRDAIEAANDVLDEIKYYELEEKIKARDGEVSVPGYKRKLFDIAKSVTVNNGRVLGKLREAAKGLEAIASDVGPFLELANSLNQHSVVNNSRETGSLLTENGVVGREKEKETIIKWLIAQPDTDEQGALSIFSIFGMGGMGKTTLVQLVCGDQIVIEKFNLILWVCISDNSETVDAKTMVKRIIEDVTKKSCSLDNLNTLQYTLMEEVRSKKFLLVLDDVWRDDKLSEWEKIVAPLRSGERGSKILLTTRMESVARMIAGMIAGENKYFHLTGLDDNDFITLFYRHAFGDTDPNEYQHLQETGKEIAKKLWANPLAAKTIGGVLSKSLNFEFWNKILNDDIFNIDVCKDNMMEILKLSYYHLPIHLQVCFRYCSIFPQDYGFKKSELVKMWMSSGLIPLDENEKKRPEDVGDEYMDQLTIKSFFDMNPDYFGHRCYFIHDLLHDLAQDVSKDECLRIVGNISVNIPQTLRHLSITMINYSMLPEIRNLSKLQTLLVRCINHDMELEQELCRILSEVKTLRVLSLTLEIVQNIPPNIGDLKHLRYFSFSCTRLNILEENLMPLKPLYKLYHLQVMNVNIKLNWDIQEGEMEDMRNLINLRYYKFNNFVTPKISEIGKLSSLQELTLFDGTNKSGSIICELKYLTGLKKLSIFGLCGISSPSDILEAKINQKNLKSLSLGWYHDPSKVRDKDEEVADNLEPPPSLNKLSISGYAGIRSPYWMNDSSCRNLTRIKLSDFYRLEHLPPLGQLISLKFLSLHDMHAVKQIGHSLYGGACAFASLRHLEFFGMPEWEEWVGVEGNFFPCLEKLAIQYCPKLKRIPSGSLLFSSLRELEFYEMPELEEWIGLENEMLFPCLKKMSIYGCPKLKRFPALSPSLSHLDIRNTALDALPMFYQISEDSTIGTSVVTRGLSLSSLRVSRCPNIVTLVGSQILQQPEDFGALKVINIRECGNLLHMPMEFLKKLLSLTGLTVLDCPKMCASEMHLPTTLKHLEFGTCNDLEPLFIRSLHYLTSLTTLHLHGCVSLQSLPPAELLARWTLLYQLEITECKELESLSGIEVLTALTYLRILRCEKLTELSKQLPLLPHNNQVDLARCDLKINTLKIDHTSLLLMEPLRSLRFTRSFLIFDDNHELTSLPEQWLMQNRFILEEILIHGVSSIPSLPSVMENLCTLRLLHIYDCRMLKSLPNLPPSLKDLYIHGCHPELADLYSKKTGLYWSRISHIPDLRITPYVEENAAPP